MADDGVDFSGRTVEEAITQAETYFGTSRAELRIDIVTQGRSGVFGIGAEAARIHAHPPIVPPTVDQPIVGGVELAPELTEEYDASGQTESDAASEHEESTDKGDENVHRESPTAAADLPEDAREVLDRILQSMGFDAVVSVRSTENPVILSVSGQNLGVLIGRRGDNLASLQFMVNLILSKGRRQWPRVVIDVENYRARREESLRSLADRIAYRVGRNGRPFTLEAMPASDRRVIHLSLRERANIETYSIGEGVSRRVVIAPVRANGDGEDRDF